MQSTKKMSSRIDRAIKRVKQRSKLPAGSRIKPFQCSGCDTLILCWNDDPILSPFYPYRVLCSYCRAVEKAENAMLYGK